MRTIVLPYGEFQTLDTDYMNDQIEKKQFWDLELRPYLDRVKPGAHVIDVGAHVGFYSGYWAATGCQVTAIEGHPKYFPLLVQNIAKNHWSSVIYPLPIFAYSRNSWLAERLDHETHASNTWLPVPPSYAENRAIALPLDAMTAMSCLTKGRLDLIKVDAQGADLHVLLGAERLIACYRPWILIEFEEKLAALHRHTADDYHRWVSEHRYRETTINENNCLWEPI